MQQRENITCLQQKTNKSYYLSTTKNKEELLPVYNKQQQIIITCLQHATKMNYYLSPTRNKEELLPV